MTVAQEQLLLKAKQAIGDIEHVVTVHGFRPSDDWWRSLATWLAIRLQELMAVKKAAQRDSVAEIVTLLQRETTLDIFTNKVDVVARKYGWDPLKQSISVWLEHVCACAAEAAVPANEVVGSSVVVSIDDYNRKSEFVKAVTAMAEKRNYCPAANGLAEWMESQMEILDGYKVWRDKVIAANENRAQAEIDRLFAEGGIEKASRQAELAANTVPCCTDFDNCQQRCLPLTNHWRDRCNAIKNMLDDNQVPGMTQRPVVERVKFVLDTLHEQLAAIKTLKAEREAAAGELLIDLNDAPVGSVAGKLMVANSVLRGQVRDMQRELGKLRSEAETNDRASTYWWTEYYRALGKKLPEATVTATREYAKELAGMKSELADLLKLVEYFDKENKDIGRQGDHDNLSTIATALRELRAYGQEANKDYVAACTATAIQGRGLTQSLTSWVLDNANAATMTKLRADRKAAWEAIGKTEMDAVCADGDLAEAIREHNSELQRAAECARVLKSVATHERTALGGAVHEFWYEPNCPQWEYRVIGPHNSTDLESVLNKSGREGWQLVGESRGMLILQRPARGEG